MNRIHSPLRPVLEGLETRVLFAAGPAVVTAVLDPAHPVLTVTGTNHADDIAVVLVGDQLEVRSAGVAVNSFPLAGVLGISVDGSNGRDTIVVDAAITLPAMLLGGRGKDLLTGGSGDDNIDGGNGKDMIAGGAGDDILSGGRGRDVIDGGDGDDFLMGGRGRDASTGGAGNDTFSGDLVSEVLDKAADETLVPPISSHG
jgi:Ca2+-binding RTX toxin-like protein